MKGTCMVCQRPARMMTPAPTRHYQERRVCCGIVYYAHYPRTIPVEAAYRERVAAISREAAL